MDSQSVATWNHTADKSQISPLLIMVKNPYVTEYYRVLFNRCDKNKDGFISLNELKRFIEGQEDKINSEVIKAVHQNFDKNGDKQLDFEEFFEMLNSPMVSKIFRRLRSRYLKFIVTTPSVPPIMRLESSCTKTGLYEEEFTFKKHTVGMITLSAIQIILYYVNMRFTDMEGHNGSIEMALKFTPLRKREIWRYFTYIFVHASVVHLFPNVFIQILIGIPLEMVHSWRVIIIYVAGAVGGCLAHAVITPKMDLVGGSGGFYAFYTAHVATVIMNWREMSHPVVHLILFGFMTIFDPVYNYFIQKQVTDISYITHLGGTVVGLLLGVNILRNLKVTRKENIVKYICLIFYSILMIVLIVLNIVIN